MMHYRVMISTSKYHVYNKQNTTNRSHSIKSMFHFANTASDSYISSNKQMSTDDCSNRLTSESLQLQAFVLTAKRMLISQISLSLQETVVLDKRVKSSRSNSTCMSEGSYGFAGMLELNEWPTKSRKAEELLFNVFSESR